MQQKSDPSTGRYTRIQPRILIYVAWRNLVSKKLRAFLTIFGIVVGIGAIFFLLSFGIGLQHLITEQVVGNKSIKSIDITTPNSKVARLDDANLQKIRDLPHVKQVGASFSSASSLKVNGGEVDSIAYAVDDKFQSMSNLTLMKGRLLNQDDNKSILLSEAAARSIGLTRDQALNKEVEINIPLADAKVTQINGRFTIVGVIDSKSNSEVFMPDHIFRIAGVDGYSRLKLETEDSASVSDLRKKVESLGFQTDSPIDTIDQINQFFKFFNVIMVGFGAIGMIVAVLGMFNTLTISLLERTKEIGLMVALGGRKRDMRKLFIFEAVLLSVVGAVIGILLAAFGGIVINIVMNTFSRRRGVTDSFDLFATPPLLILGTIAFMVVVGLLVVYFPARHAERINPIDALRRE